MTTIIVTMPPKECSLADIYKLLAVHGQTLAMRHKYRNALNEHVKTCKNCQAYNEYMRLERWEPR